MSVKNKNYDFIATELFLSVLLDRSNFKVLPKLEDKAQYEAGDLGLYKSELSDDIAIEGIFYQQSVTASKQYLGKNVLI